MIRNASGRSSKMDSYEHVLMCLICRSLFDDYDHQPKFLPCHHTFCKDCLREFVRQMGDEIDCPSCRKPATIPAAGVSALQTNFYAKYIQSLVYGLGGASGSCGSGQDDVKCSRHDSQKASYFCKDCLLNVCNECISDNCSEHTKQSIVAVAEDFQNKIEVSFAQANDMIERKKVDLEAKMKSFSEDKDKSLLRIDGAFESHAHLLNRRATLLKNKVIDSYNEKVESFENLFEDLSTAMTCIVSLKEFHETAISRGQLADALKGVDELDEVYKNIHDGVKPRSCHILFNEKHGVEKFKSSVKDLGRVNCIVDAYVDNNNNNKNNRNNNTSSGDGGGGSSNDKGGDDDNTQEATPVSPLFPSTPSFNNNINNLNSNIRVDAINNNNVRMENVSSESYKNKTSNIASSNSETILDQNNKQDPTKVPTTRTTNTTAQSTSGIIEPSAWELADSKMQRPFSARFKKSDVDDHRCNSCSHGEDRCGVSEKRSGRNENKSGGVVGTIGGGVGRFVSGGCGCGVASGVVRKVNLAKTISSPVRRPKNFMGDLGVIVGGEIAAKDSGSINNREGNNGDSNNGDDNNGDNNNGDNNKGENNNGDYNSSSNIGGGNNTSLITSKVFNENDKFKDKYIVNENSLK